ncbi:MAG: GyrI-like domain-containing protein [Rhodospirillales bacterium]|nr:GyrI-like domain-containing protein [Rhodospirillales bacterium]
MTGTNWRALGLAVAWLALSPAWGAESTPTPTAPATPTPATPSPAPIPATSPTPVATPTPAASPSPAESGALGEIVELTTRPAAFIEAKAKREEVYGAIMGDLAKIRAELAKAGLKPQGHALAVFLSADDDGFTYRAMVPIETAPDPKLQLADGIKLGQTPVGKAMRFEHRGEYDEIDSTYDAITAYLDEKGVDAQDVFMEEYLNEPKSSDDPNLQADIYVLLR